MFGITARNSQSCELFFDTYHQLDTIEPVSTEIFCEVRFIRDAPDINMQVPGDESADFVNLEKFFMAVVREKGSALPTANGF